MQNTITFHITDDDKINLKKLAEAERLSLSSFCRFILTKQIQENKVEAVQ